MGNSSIRSTALKAQLKTAIEPCREPAHLKTRADVRAYLAKQLAAVRLRSMEQPFCAQQDLAVLKVIFRGG